MKSDLPMRPPAELTTNVFSRVLGEHAFAKLPPAVRALHSGVSKTIRGSAEIQRGRGMLARVCGFLTSLPAAHANAECSVQIVINPHSETWRRQFAQSVMRSHLSARDGQLVERLGVVRFGFALLADDTGFIWRVQRVWILGIPVPAACFRHVYARSFADERGYRFEVSASLPIVGFIVCYRGRLA